MSIYDHIYTIYLGMAWAYLARYLAFPEQKRWEACLDNRNGTELSLSNCEFRCWMCEQADAKYWFWYHYNHCCDVHTVWRFESVDSTLKSSSKVILQMLNISATTRVWDEGLLFYFTRSLIRKSIYPFISAKYPDTLAQHSYVFWLIHIQMRTRTPVGLHRYEQFTWQLDPSAEGGGARGDAGFLIASGLSSRHL